MTSPIDITAPTGARATVIHGPDAARALTVTGGGDMTWRGLTVTGARAGLVSSGAELRLEDVVVRDNGPAADDGAGIQVAGGSVSLVRGTVSGNTIAISGDAVGAGISVRPSATLDAVNSTIHGNAATTTGTIAYGGGIGAYSNATVTLRHVTLTDNRVASASAAQDGGNLYRAGSSAVTVEDSILAGGATSFGPNNCSTSKPVAQGRNLDSGSTCGFGSGHFNGIDPQLGTLRAHGGTTDTRRPAAGSLARDNAVACDAGGTDQRGALAPAGATCDIGAVELGGELVTSLDASRATVAAGADLTLVARVTNAGFDPAPLTELVVVPGAEIVSVIPSGGACDLALRCTFGVLEPGESGTAVVTVRAPQSGPVVSTASGSSGLPDPTPADATASRVTPVDVPAAAPTPAVPTAPTVPPAPTVPSALPDRTAPVLGALRAVGKMRRGKAASIRTTLSEGASVSVRVERVVAGRRVGKACRTGRRTGRRCSIFRLVGTVKATGKAGTVTIRLPARIKRKALARGRHRLRVTATDAAGNRSKVRQLTITVVR